MSRLRVVVLVGGLLGLVVLGVIGVALRSRGLTVAANVAQVVSVVLGAPSLAVGLLRWWRRWSAPAAPGTTEIMRAKDVLAGLVAEQWKAEAAIRALDDPDPIPVRWRAPYRPPTARALMDHPANIEPGAGADGGMWWTASSADIPALADRFRRTRRRRLVILGGTGMGKTTLAVQLLLHLLDTRTPDEPIPVLLPVASWDTNHFGLHDWLTDQLTLAYPALRSPELGTDVVRALTRRGHVLPVLDGLDELPPPARAKLITALNSALGRDGQLILTSRTSEFTTAINDANDVVTSAAVLEPLPLSPAAAADYLTLSLPPAPGSGWQQVLTDLRISPPPDQAAPGTPHGGPGAVLAEVAATPLGLWLLRTVYARPGTDPTELTNPDRFPTPAIMRAHLFNQLIPALITARPPSDDPTQPSPFRPSRHHDPARVQRYLGYLAHHLNHIPTGNNQTGTRDFAWWHLARHTLRPQTHRLAAGLAVGLVGGIAFGVAFGLAFGIAFGIAVGLVAGLTGGNAFEPEFWLTVGLRVGIVGRFGASSWLQQTPGFAKLVRRPTSLAHLLKGVFAGGFAGVFVGVFAGGLVGVLAVVFANGLAVALAGELANGLSKGLANRLGLGPVHEHEIENALLNGRAIMLEFALEFGLVGGLAGGLTGGFIHWVETPTTADQASTPLITWRADRSLNLLKPLAGGLTGGLTGGLAGGFVLGLAGVLVDGLASVFGFRDVLAPADAVGLVGWIAGGLVFGFVGGLMAGHHHAWLVYVVATYRLARRRLLPRRLMPFLDDMHRLGLLRAVGPFYQFRHAELQDHFAATYRPHEQPKGQRNAVTTDTNEQTGR